MTIDEKMYDPKGSKHKLIQGEVGQENRLKRRNASIHQEENRHKHADHSAEAQSWQSGVKGK